MTDVLNAKNNSLPAGLKNAFAFVAFNALSFQMVLGSPMILFAKSLNASATVLGIISGMMPLLVIFQIPAASHVPRYGYKRFVYGGWGIRVLFIFVMALVPVSGRFLEPSSQLALMLFLLFGFNLSRGISSCAWLPWITSLVPASVRGKYLAQEAAFINVASFGAFLLAAWCLGSQPRASQFALIFAFSALMGTVSLFFLKRIPEGEAPEEARVSTHPVPWIEIARYRPFRKLLWMNVGWSMAYGGLGAFTVAFLKTEAGMPEGKILVMNSVAYLGGLSSLWFLGSRMDRLGSKPILTFSLASWCFIILGWIFLAGGVWPSTLRTVAILQFAMGLGLALINMANTRLAMATVPVMGRNHFFALFSVVANLTLGLAPIIWGVLIDAMRSVEFRWHGFEWNRFTMFFILVAIVMLVTIVLCRRLEEPDAARMEDLFREILIESPQRVWLRIWPRE
ncbi:MAG: MFS transporter [Verrucomicrobia bacterium]|nr:MFS transporter [Verrucomicrobiota bacterium]